MKLGHVVSLGLCLAAALAISPAASRLPTASPAPNDAANLAALLGTPLFHEADRLATKLLAQPGLDGPALALCGLAVLRAGRIGEAGAIFEKAARLAPDCPEAHLGLGRLARIRNDEDAAVAHLRRAVASVSFFEDASRQLWRAAWTRGDPTELEGIRALVEERYRRRTLDPPSWLVNNVAQIRGLTGKRLYGMEGRFERLRIPLVPTSPHARGRMISLELNDRIERPFHIDSALAEFMTVSPLLAERLGLAPTGSATSAGVGSATIVTRFAVLDTVRIGPVTFRNVPVMVSDVQTLRGLEEGLIGTAFLKRFNVTIDVAARAMVLCPLDRPDLLAAGIDRGSVAADVPLYCYDATTVEAALEGAPSALYILDTAASTNLVDRPFFGRHIKPMIDPSRIVRAGIRGAGGPQSVDQVEGLSVRFGPLVIAGLQFNEFSMETLNMIPGRYTAGLLGNPVLWPYRVHMDFRRGRLILEK